MLIMPFTIRNILDPIRLVWKLSPLLIFLPEKLSILWCFKLINAVHIRKQILAAKMKKTFTKEYKQEGSLL